MQFGHRGGLAAKRGDLAEHVKSVSRADTLRFEPSSLEPRSCERSTPLVATRKRPTFKPSRASRISSVESPLGRSRIRSSLEPGHERCGADSDLVAGPRLEQHGRLRSEAPRSDSGATMAPVATASLREEVGCPDQDSHFHAADRQGTGEGSHQGSRPSIMNSAGEDEPDLIGG